MGYCKSARSLACPPQEGALLSHARPFTQSLDGPRRRSKCPRSTRVPPSRNSSRINTCGSVLSKQLKRLENEPLILAGRILHNFGAMQAPLESTLAKVYQNKRL